MLKPRDIDRDDAGSFAWAAIQDLQRRNTNGKSHFTAAQIAQGMRMKIALEMCYTGDFYEPTHRAGRAPHRNKCIAIKIGNARIMDKKALKFLTDGWQQDPSIVVDPVRTNQGIIYRVYFT
jgi:hypothetical protein